MQYAILFYIIISTNYINNTNMSITIKKNISPDLKICKMTCDKPLHKRLDNFELTSLMNGTGETNLLIGRPRSGKTSLLYSLFKSKELFKKLYHNVYLFRPPSSGSSMDDDIFDTLPEDQKFSSVTEESLREVEERLKQHKLDDEYTTIIFDDVTASLKDLDLQKSLHQLIFNRRHVNCTIWFLVQSFKSIQKDLRNMFSNIFIFKVSKGELTNIFEEVVEIDKRHVNPISKICYSKKGDFLFVNVDNKRLFKGWDEIFINDEDD